MERYEEFAEQGSAKEEIAHEAINHIISNYDAWLKGSIASRKASIHNIRNTLSSLLSSGSGTPERYIWHFGQMRILEQDTVIAELITQSSTPTINEVRLALDVYAGNSFWEMFTPQSQLNFLSNARATLAATIEALGGVTAMDLPYIDHVVDLEIAAHQGVSTKLHFDNTVPNLEDLAAKDGMWAATLAVLRQKMKMEAIHLVLGGKMGSDEYKNIRRKRTLLETVQAGTSQSIQSEHTELEASWSDEGPEIASDLSYHTPADGTESPTAQTSGSVDHLILPESEHSTNAARAPDFPTSRSKRSKLLSASAASSTEKTGDTLFWPPQSYPAPIDPSEINWSLNLYSGDVPTKFALEEARLLINDALTDSTISESSLPPCFGLLTMPEPPDWVNLLVNGKSCMSQRGHWVRKDIRREIPTLPTQYPKAVSEYSNANWSRLKATICVLHGVRPDYLADEVAVDADEFVADEKGRTKNARLLNYLRSEATKVTSRAALIINGWSVRDWKKALNELTPEQLLFNTTWDLLVYQGKIRQPGSDKLYDVPIPRKIPPFLAAILRQLGRKVPTLNWLYSKYPYLPRNGAVVTGQPLNADTTAEEWPENGSVSKDSLFGMVVKPVSASDFAAGGSMPKKLSNRGAREQAGARRKRKRSGPVEVVSHGENPGTPQQSLSTNTRSTSPNETTDNLSMASLNHRTDNDHAPSLITRGFNTFFHYQPHSQVYTQSLFGTTHPTTQNLVSQHYHLQQHDATQQPYGFSVRQVDSHTS
ncbi:hypothetical protein EJ08DRAFT_661993 [Tothia fuscella]|uniref:Uncharacterized protein n=1 Tax=Tothia fuscella TaxID=1048955 RepID=A0A9P4NPB7_9PEZI|nr:hypothetical protein EJ08DRAFT_661993 [Tothia fuscella]